MRDKIDEEIKKILLAKDTAMLKWQDNSISQQIYNKLNSDYKIDELLAIDGVNGDESKLLAHVKRINLKIRLAQPTSTAPLQTTLVPTNSEISKPKIIPEEMLQYVPKKEDYIQRALYGKTDVDLVQELYGHKDFILVVGATGCGKTHLLRYIASKNAVPYMRVNLNGATTPEDLIGQWIPNPNSDSTAKYIWQDGLLTKFMRNGGIFVVDEINMAPADILSMLHSVTDDERKLVLTQKDGEVIVANKDFWFAATMNPDYEGTKPLNLALKDRFRIIEMSYDDKVEKRLQINEKLREIANKLRRNKEVSTPVSTRDLIKFRDDLEKYGEAVAKAFFINNFEKTEAKAVKEIIDLALDSYSLRKKQDDSRMV